jgi:heme exporter protein A
MEKKGTHFLQGSGLCCIRDDRVLFEGLAFEIGPGQVLLLEGKNGSGKTSLLRILCGFRQPDAGQVRWCGEAVNDSLFYARMAYVGHLDGIKKELSVMENLAMALALSQPGRYSMQQALARVHLAGYDDILVQSLSAGQKRRLSLARLLMTENDLWILDEPFTALDKQGIALFEAVMSEHCSNGGMIVLTSHHDVVLHGIDVRRIHLS